MLPAPAVSTSCLDRNSTTHSVGKGFPVQDLSRVQVCTSALTVGGPCKLPQTGHVAVVPTSVAAASRIVEDTRAKVRSQAPVMLPAPRPKAHPHGTTAPIIGAIATRQVTRPGKLERFSSTASVHIGDAANESGGVVGNVHIDDLFGPVQMMPRWTPKCSPRSAAQAVSDLKPTFDHNEHQMSSRADADAALLLETDEMSHVLFGATPRARERHQGVIARGQPNTPSAGVPLHSRHSTPTTPANVGRGPQVVGVPLAQTSFVLTPQSNTSLMPPPKSAGDATPLNYSILTPQSNTSLMPPPKSAGDATPQNNSMNSGGRSAARSSADGRPSKTEMSNAPLNGMTVNKIQEMGRNPKCSRPSGSGCCLYRENVSECMALGSNIMELWTKFNMPSKDFHKGQALLDYMWEHEVSTESKKKKLEFKIPGTSDLICGNCWRLCSGFSQASGRPTTLYTRILGRFNDGHHNAKVDRVSGSSHKVTGAMKDELRVAVTAFLDTWLEHNSDLIPEDVAFNNYGPPRAHVDVARKTDIWNACCLYLEQHYKQLCSSDKRDGKPKKPISFSYFMKLLNSQVTVVIHKHKRFSQCVTCFLFKQLIAKCTNPEDMKEIRAHRKHHFDTVFAERVVYHQCRNYAKDNPEEALSMILDAQTKWRTQGPTLPREVGSGFPPGFEAFGQQLYGCLVHASDGDVAHLGGFFGYMVDDSVRGGGNVTCEIIYKTLVKLQVHRKVWPALLDVRLDNTTKDNKNKCVFGFFGWLVLTDVFKKVRVRYLSVGHTHEDIDALFGVLMQQLYKGHCYATIEILMDAIYDSFFCTGVHHSKGSRPSAKLEHLRATHDWTAWLTTACQERDEQKPAVNKLEHFARRVPDSHRPHEFVFTKMMIDGVMCVVLNYKHWSKDEEFWNKKPIIIFDHVPKVEHLQPSSLNPMVTVPLSKCAAAPHFTDHSNLCSSAAGAANGEGSKAPSQLKACPRCKVQVGLSMSDQMYKSSAMFTESDQDAWAQRWSQMNQESANQSLQAVAELRTYCVQEPRLPYVMPACMEGPTDAYLSVEPVTYAGYSESKYQKLLKEAGLRSVQSDVHSGSTFAGVTDVLGVKKNRGQIEAAVLWDDPTTIDGGTWIPVADLNVLFQPSEAGDDDAANDEDTDELRSRQTAADDLETSTQLHNWNLYFGRDMSEDTDVLVGFTQGRSTTVYAGVLIAGDFDDSNGCQRVHFPVMQADPLFGTSAQTVHSDFISLRLDSLVCIADDGTRDSAVSFWIKKQYVALPFITKAMPVLKVATEIPDKPAKPNRARKSRVARISSESDEDEQVDPAANKISKLVPTAAPAAQAVRKRQQHHHEQPLPAPKPKKPKPKATFDDLLAQMRGKK